jgi:hypothetical protein
MKAEFDFMNVTKTPSIEYGNNNDLEWFKEMLKQKIILE